jgi:DNA-binding transcriptional ArsR family regulator
MHDGVVSLTITITGLPHDGIVFAPSSLAELGQMLHVLSEPGHHPGLHGWVTATAGRLPPDLADRLYEADFLWRSTRSDILMPAQPRATLTEELDLLDKLDNEAFVGAALEIACAVRYGRSLTSPLTCVAERDRARGLAAARGSRQAAFADRLLSDPETVRVWLRRLFEDCDEVFFGETWLRLGPHLAADARHKADLLRHAGLAEVVGAISPALSLNAEGTRIVVDKLRDGAVAGAEHGLLFVPTYFGRPHLVVSHALDGRPALQYPATAPGTAQSTSLEMTQRRLEALAHPIRMRMCRTLARGPHTTGELASTIGLTPPEISRHVAVLKKAGLLTGCRRGRYVLHELDLSAVSRLGSDFLEGMLR